MERHHQAPVQVHLNFAPEMCLVCSVTSSVPAWSEVVVGLSAATWAQAWVGAFAAFPGDNDPQGS